MKTRPGAPRSPRSAHVVVVAAAAEDYGSDRMLLHSVEALRGSHRVTVILPADGPLRGRLEAEGAIVHVFTDYALRRRYLAPHRIPGLLARNARSTLRLRRLHRRDPIDLVVTNTEAVVLGGIVAWVIGRPHLWHVHEILDRPARFAHGMATLVHRLTDRVVACSPAVQAHLLRLRPELAGRTTVVANAVPLPAEATEPSAGPTLPLRVGCIGRIHPRKGQNELVSAWLDGRDRLAALARPTELHFYGEPLDGQGRMVQDLQERLDAAGCGAQAHFHGFVADPEAIYRDLDLVVVPSVQPESFSLVCAEAQAYGLAVIAPASGGPADTVRNGITGLLVDPADIQTLARALVRLLSDDGERNRLGTAGRQWCEATFSLDRYRREIRGVVDATILGTTPPIVADPAGAATPAATTPALLAGANR